MGFFFYFYDNENDNRNMIVPEEYRDNDIIDDDDEDELGNFELNLVMPSEVYHHIFYMAKNAEMSIEEYVMRMATYGQIDDREEDNYESCKY